MRRASRTRTVPIYQLWDVEAGVSLGVFLTADAADAFEHATIDAEEEGRPRPTEERTEVRVLRTLPSDPHDAAEVETLVIRRFPYAAR